MERDHATPGSGMGETGVRRGRRGGTICLGPEGVPMTKAFASQSDLADKRISFTELGGGGYAYTAEGDPNSGVVVGDDGVMVLDTQATPVMAEDVIRRIRDISQAPIRYVVLTHYHAVRVLGASAYGAGAIIA